MSRPIKANEKCEVVQFVQNNARPLSLNLTRNGTKIGKTSLSTDVPGYLAYILFKLYNRKSIRRLLSGNSCYKCQQSNEKKVLTDLFTFGIILLR